MNYRYAAYFCEKVRKKCDKCEQYTNELNSHEIFCLAFISTLAEEKLTVTIIKCLVYQKHTRTALEILMIIYTNFNHIL